MNASQLQNPTLIINGKNVTVEAHIIGNRPIIHYADISDFVIWKTENKIELLVAKMEENQFLGPYLDHPEEEAWSLKHKKPPICSILPDLYKNSLVYGKPVDYNMPIRASRESAPLQIIESAILTPGFLKEEQTVTISVKLKLPKEEINEVWIALPFANVPIEYKENNGWAIEYKCPAKREEIIMDISFFRVWTVLKSGLVSEPVDIPIKWHY